MWRNCFIPSTMQTNVAELFLVLFPDFEKGVKFYADITRNMAVLVLDFGGKKRYVYRVWFCTEGRNIDIFPPPHNVNPPAYFLSPHTLWQKIFLRAGKCIVFSHKLRGIPREIPCCHFSRGIRGMMPPSILCGSEARRKESNNITSPDNILSPKRRNEKNN